MAWTKYEGQALANSTLTGAELAAELEAEIRRQNPNFTDVRVGHARAITDRETAGQQAEQWYDVTYFAEDPAGAQ